MLHPLISTVIQRPDLVVDHASAYASLFRKEATDASKELLGKAISWGLALVCGLLFVILAAIAVMMGFLHQAFHWSLLVVPAVPLVVAVLAFVNARKPLASDRFTELRAQLDSDAQALRMAA
ncbi:MAG: hypothetical protein JWP47_1251 [Polaromonas sp.]|jgi:peptidoglycan/LPS O-acetylase OafA/YrhL|nr:hypothetical protein [Polaromonas sp.]